MKSFVLLSMLVIAAVALPPEWQRDGFPLERFEKRIIGGQIAATGQFPYYARLMLTKRRFGRIVGSLCGGSLISNRVVLTAAHCVDQALSGLVYVGSSTIHSTETASVTIKVEKTAFIIHEGWNSLSFSNDIALILLPRPVQFNNVVKPVNLPKANEGDLVGRTGVISGFGLIGNSGGPAQELRYLPRRIMEPKYCNSAYPTRFSSSSHVCVDGSYAKSACPGDSGGPLVLEEANGSGILVGLTSFGSMSCEMGYPTVYTRITSYLNWINQKTDTSIRN
uniref:Venom polypeptide n=1 Tax=Dolopus genitalis TaxID=2488630 RepID=A0A3G5BIJ7_DOLGE|nr:venom polypeptide [Dolopus genitalis]